MRIDTVKKNLRTNHTVRWAGYQQPGTKRNGIIFAKYFIHNNIDIFNSSNGQHKKYAKYFPVKQADGETPDSETLDNNQENMKLNMCSLKYDSTIRCCQMCGGRFTCKALEHEANQYGKGIYRQKKKYLRNLYDDYDDYNDGIIDACDKMIDE